MDCWRCGAPLDISGKEKISFRASCKACHAPLHCCKNCINYKPGRPNDCMVPDTEYVANREAMNFCEEFQILGKKVSKGSEPNAKNRFNSLFKDEP